MRRLHESRWGVGGSGCAGACVRDTGFNGEKRSLHSRFSGAKRSPRCRSMSHTLACRQPQDSGDDWLVRFERCGGLAHLFTLFLQAERGEHARNSERGVLLTAVLVLLLMYGPFPLAPFPTSPLCLAGFPEARAQPHTHRYTQHARTQLLQHPQTQPQTPHTHTPTPTPTHPHPYPHTHTPTHARTHTYNHTLNAQHAGRSHGSAWGRRTRTLGASGCTRSSPGLRSALTCCSWWTSSPAC